MPSEVHRQDDHAGAQPGAGGAAPKAAHSHTALRQLRFLQEIKRRNVGRAALLYLVACWALLEPVHVVFHMLEVPIWANRLVLVLMGLGLPGVLIFAWVYELTPDGVKPTAEVAPGRSIRQQTARRLDRAIIVVMSLALTYFAVDKIWLSRHVPSSTDRARVTATHEDTNSIAQEPHIGVLPVEDKSIAVLPFVDFTEKQDQAYLADGMAEEVIDLLARIPHLKVIGRTSSFQFRGRAIDVRSIGTTLGVAYVLEGSVRRSGDTVRVTAQLLTTRDGSHRWANTYDTRLDDVVKVQDAIALSIARALQIAVGEIPIRAERTGNPVAYDLFLRGMHAFAPFDAPGREGCEQAIALFTQALQVDTQFAPAAAGVAWAYAIMGQAGWLPPTLAFERARINALHALELDPKLAAAHAVLADIHLIFDWDWAATQREIDTAFALGGRDAWTLETAARLASARDPGSDSAVTLFREAISRDPLSRSTHIMLGWLIYMRTGRYLEAERLIRRGLHIAPKFPSGQYWLAVNLLMQGRLDEALLEANKESLDDGRLEASAAIYHLQHRERESRAALEQAIERNGKSWASNIAKVYAFLGEADQALEWLDRAYAQRDEDLHFIKGDPMLRGLEQDARYQAFLKKMNLSDVE